MASDEDLLNELNDDSNDEKNESADPPQLISWDQRKRLPFKKSRHEEDQGVAIGFPQSHHPRYNVATEQ